MRHKANKLHEGYRHTPHTITVRKENGDISYREPDKTPTQQDSNATPNHDILTKEDNTSSPQSIPAPNTETTTYQATSDIEAEAIPMAIATVIYPILSSQEDISTSSKEDSNRPKV